MTTGFNVGFLCEASLADENEEHKRFKGKPASGWLAIGWVAKSDQSNSLNNYC